MKAIALYADYRHEVATAGLCSELTNQGYLVAYPKVIGPDRHMGFFSVAGSHELRPGVFGILEPTDVAPEVHINKLDMILVPGVVFDQEGYRIGYGHGYYDRILNGAQAKCVGLAYSFQVISHVPHGVNDVRMDVIITDKGHIKK